MKFGPVLARVPALLLVLAGTAVQAQSASASADSPGSFCDRSHPLDAEQQDLALRFAAVIRAELNRDTQGAALVSRSGLDLSRFHIRYSHAAVAWRDDKGVWSARQLYYACEERRPRLFDQGIPGFAMGIDDPALGYVSIVRLPKAAAGSLRQAALDNSLALHLLGADYSADAYPFSTLYQNCNQWLAEMLAVAWGGLPDGDGLRERAQHWLRDANYRPEPVDVNSHLLMFASSFVPLIHLKDHPEADLYAMKLKISLPASLEDFVRQREPNSERVEICHDAHQVVVHRGWSRIDDGCRAADGDEVIPFD